MSVEEKMIEILDKFQQREDNCLWDLHLSVAGEDKIRIFMETNEAYMRGRDGVMKVKLDRLIGLDEEDHIDEIFANNYITNKHVS